MKFLNDCPLTVGAAQVSPPLVLAPMSGVTNSCFRRLIRQENPGAVGLVVTEFISIEGLTRENRKSLEMLRFRSNEHPISIQIFGFDIERMVDAALMVQDAGADIVDINCGCPVPKVVKRGGGCELMRQPDQLARILSAVRHAVSIPVTLKIRAGWDETDRNAIQVARMAEECGISMLAVHGRTRSQLYRGEADWSLIRDVAEAVSIPVIGSGDVVDAASARARLTGKVAGLMIGRAALSNPWVFSEIEASYSGRVFETPSAVRTVEVMERYMALMLEEFPEKSVLGRMKQLTSQVTRRVRGSSAARSALCNSKDLSQFRNELHRFRDAIESGAYSRRDYEFEPSESHIAL